MRALLSSRTASLLPTAFGAARQGSRSTHLSARRIIVCEAERQQQGETATGPATPQAPPAAPVRTAQHQRRMPPPPPSPYGENVKVRSLQWRVWKLRSARLCCSRAGPAITLDSWVFAAAACLATAVQIFLPHDVQIERVETLGESRFSGVVSLDSGETPDNLQ